MTVSMPPSDSSGNSQYVSDLSGDGGHVAPPVLSQQAASPSTRSGRIFGALSGLGGRVSKRLRSNIERSAAPEVREPDEVGVIAHPNLGQLPGTPEQQERAREYQDRFEELEARKRGLAQGSDHELDAMRVMLLREEGDAIVKAAYRDCLNHNITERVFHFITLRAL